MSTTITETTTQVGRDAQNTVNASLPTDTKKEAAANNLASQLNTEEVKKKAYDDVKELAKTIRGIRKMFQTINLTLVGFDNEKFKDKDSKEITLSPEWKTRMDLFETVMQTSYENAQSAVDVMKEITSILGTDINTTPVTYADLKVEVDGFLLKIAEKREGAIASKNSFRNLADNVRLFSARIDIALEQASEGLKVELENARSRVKDLTKKLEDIDKEVRSLTAGIAAAIAVGATAGILAFFTLSPVAVGIAISSAATAAALGVELAGKLDEKKKKQQEKVDAQADVEKILERQKLLEKYVKKLEGTKGEIDQVAKQIDTITNIWQTIDLDMLSIKESLEKNVAGNVQITGFFWIKLKPAKETYKRLTECLETYVEQSRSVYDDA